MNERLLQLGWNSSFESEFANFNALDIMPGRIFLEQKSEYLVLTKDKEVTAKLAGKIRHKAESKLDLPTVGDWVVIRLLEDGSGVIEAILTRTTQISRIAAGNRKKQNLSTSEKQLIGANVDTIFIVAGLDRDYNLRRIERYLTLVYNSGANPVVVLNKVDLCDDIDSIISDIENVAFGVPIHAISAITDDNLDLFKSYFKTGTTVALLGSSGVGKSTIINKLLGNDRQKIGEISESVNKGQHTTTNRELILLPDGGLIMDNPGMREIVLMAGEDDVEDTFQEIEEFAQYCKFNDCKHLKEPNCAVKQAVIDGELDEDRYESYQKMIREAQYFNDKQKMGVNRADKEKWTKLYKQEGKNYKKK